MSHTPKRKVPRKITESSLRNIALHYLERFATSRENLRRVLERRVYKSHTHHGTDLTEAALWIKDLLDNLESGNLINDRAYAEGRAIALHRRGSSPRMIALKLREKGLRDADINHALSGLREDHGEDLERSAALRLARRRRLGPFRPPEKRDALRDKDMAALARAGFSYDLAREIIDLDDPDELEDLL